MMDKHILFWLGRPPYVGWLKTLISLNVKAIKWSMGENCIEYNTRAFNENDYCIMLFHNRKNNERYMLHASIV